MGRILKKVKISNILGCILTIVLLLSLSIYAVSETKQDVFTMYILDVKSGDGQTVLGQRGLVRLGIEEFDSVTYEEFVRFCENQVADSGLKYITVIRGTGKGLVFAGSDPYNASFGVIDDTGGLTNSEWNISYNFDTEEYEFFDKDWNKIKPYFNKLDSNLLNSGYITEKLIVENELTDIDSYIYEISDNIKIRIPDSFGTVTKLESNKYSYFYPSTGMMMIAEETIKNSLIDDDGFEKILSGMSSSNQLTFTNKQKIMIGCNVEAYSSRITGNISGQSIDGQFVCFQIDEDSIITFTYVDYVDSLGDRESGITDFEKILYSLDVVIDGYIYPEFEKFNSFATENGLSGTKIYIDGNIVDFIPSESFYEYRIKDTNDHEWMLIISDISIVNDELVNSLIGKNVRVFSEYIGWSGVYEIPCLSLFDEEGELWKRNKIIDKDNNQGYLAIDFLDTY